MASFIEKNRDHRALFRCTLRDALDFCIALHLPKGSSYVYTVGTTMCTEVQTLCVLISTQIL